MSDNSVTLSAIQLADRAIRRAMANQSSCEAEIKVALGAIRYIGEALRRESEFKSLQFSLIDPTRRGCGRWPSGITRTARRPATREAAMTAFAKSWRRE
jgi:hypothetical protein